MSIMRHSIPLSLTLWLAGLGAAAQYGKISVIFDRLPQVYPQAGAALGWTVSMVGMIGIALGLVAGILAARIGLRRALLAGLWTGAAVSLLAAPGNAVLCLAFAAALGLVQGASFAAVPQLNTAPESRAMANGGMAQMGNIGNTLGTPAIAWAINFGGHAAMMLALAAALMAGCLVHLWLAHLRRQGGY